MLIQGTSGDDNLTGTSGDDTINGLAGDDVLLGDAGNDSLSGGSGNDYLRGGDGNDTIDGGTGVDEVSYYDAIGGVVVNLANGTASGAAGIDVLVSIENIEGSNFDDMLIGDSGDNILFGLVGNDTLTGGAGIDTAMYFSSFNSININLSTNTGQDGFGGTDFISGVENVVGSSHDDTIIGDSANNGLTGNAGNDSLAGNGGDDFLDGGAGNDTLDGGSQSSFGDTVTYSSANTGVVVDLTAGTAQDGLGGTDTLVNIENVIGSAFNDSIKGNSASNFISGIGGNDTIDGAGGFDTVNYEQSNVPVSVNLLTGVASRADGNDVLISIEAAHGSRFDDVVVMSNTTGGNVFGRAGNDSLVGGTGDDFFVPGSGNDTINGGPGFDTVAYDNDGFDMGPPATGNGVNVNLVTGIAIDNWGNTDSFTGIELVNGSPFADTLTGGNPLNGTGTTDGFEGFTGNGGNDLIDGGAGFDRVSYTTSPAAVNVTLGGPSPGTASDGFGGTDTLINIEEVRGSNFADTLTGSNSATFFESFEGRGGNDTINGLGGTDRASYQTSPAGANVNLQAGTASDGWGGIDTLVNIENARGSDFNDTITGNAGNNNIDGRLGNDQISGGAGADTLSGNGGNDTLDGGSQLIVANTANQSNEYDAVSYTDATSGVTVILGIDGTAGSGTGGGVGTDVLIDVEQVFGSPFNDTISGTNRAVNEIIRGGLGNDLLNGGASTGTDLGFNHVDYRTAPGSVTVNLLTGTASGADGDDTLIGFRGILAGDFSDLLIGDATDNYFEGHGGDDTINGGAGNDRASYSSASGPVNVNLATGSASGAEGNDVLISIENLRGSEFGDTLTGDAGSNDIQARAGNDTVIAGAGQDTVYGGLGDDSLDGGTNDTVLGYDWISYSVTANGVNVNFATHTATGEGTDTFINFEAVMGSPFDDTLTGDALDNVLRGNGGNDQIDGGAGNDWVDYFAATGAVVVNLALGTGTGADGTDTLTNIEGVRGSNFDDLLTGDAGNNRLRGNGGNDTLDGGAGTDAVDYYNATGPVTVRLAQGTATGGDGNDTLISIEGIYGSFNYGDDLRGDDGPNFIDGRGGNDSIDGGKGDDTLQGGAGDDTLDGGAGTNVAVYTGNFADYTIYTTAGDDDLFVSGPEGTDRLRHIDRIDFADRSYAVIFGQDGHNDSLEGGAADEMIHGRSGDDVVGGGGGNDAVYGDEGNDSLSGDQGNDYLDGGTGADTMRGGSGDDTYVVDSPSDVVAEDDGALARAKDPLTINLGGGIDTVVSSISYTLGNFIENLVLAKGVTNINGTGNALANQVHGNDGDNVLAGAAGDDTIDGAGGVDTAVFNGARSLYTVSAGANSMTVSSAAEGSDLLRNVERLQFTDGTYAVGSAAAAAAQVIGVIFGAGAVADKDLVGHYVALFDNGLTVEEGVAAAVASDRFVQSAGSHTDAAFVNIVYQNLVGVAPSAETRDSLVGLISAGVFTQASMGAYAAGLASAPATGVALTSQAVSVVAGSDDNGDVLAGTAGADVMVGRAGNDVLTPLGGNDIVVGGAGIDRAVFSGAKSAYAVTHNDLGLLVSGAGETDALIGVERATFSNLSVAYDINGNAGTVAKVVGAIFGAAALADKALVGQYLALLDAGQSYEQVLGTAAASDRFGAEAGGHSNAQFVDRVYFNLAGIHPAGDVAAQYVALLGQPGYTQSYLGTLAADTSYNLANVGLAGLALTGLEYTVA